MAISFLEEKEEIVNAFIITDGSNVTESYYHLNDIESIVINKKNDFELALVLKKKQFNAEILTKSILNRIAEKKEKFLYMDNKEGICLIGHSQIDDWGINQLANMNVRNCGIRGISSFEYENYILQNRLLSCIEDVYAIMHGTNDIVYEEYSLDDILNSISKTIAYIRTAKPDSMIYFISCIHVNGRMDRANPMIDRLNEKLKAELKNVKWIDTGKLDDEFGNLKQEYTKDGLHLSDSGYAVLREIIENVIKRGA